MAREALVLKGVGENMIECKIVKEILEARKDPTFQKALKKFIRSTTSL